MRDVLFAAADIWMIAIGFICGIKFIRTYSNWLIGLEWIIMATSGTNFLIYGVTKAGADSPMYHIAYFLDAFSRSIGFTVILVLGLLAVTHRCHPPRSVEVGAFALAGILGYFLSEFATEIGTPGKVFFLVMALGVSAFFVYYGQRLWALGEHTHAVWVWIATVLNVVVASIYDFWHIPGDDAAHTLFYILALFTWGLTMLVVYRSYVAFDAHNRAADGAGSAGTAVVQGAEQA